MPSLRGKDADPRAKAPTGNLFSSKWRYLKDVGLYDLRQLLFKCNEMEGCLPKIKGHDKDDLLAVVQYITALDPSEPLDTRNRTLVSHWYFVYARIFFMLIAFCLFLTSRSYLMKNKET